MKHMRANKLISANTAISMLSKKHGFYPLEKLFYARDFLSFLSKSQQNLISKLFVKNESLYILTKSNAGLQELKHDDTKKNIKILIKLYAKNTPKSKFDCIKELKIFTDKYLKPPTKKQGQKNNFIELAQGNFHNKLENELLHFQFEELRASIKNARSKA